MALFNRVASIVFPLTLIAMFLLAGYAFAHTFSRECTKWGEWRYGDTPQTSAVYIRGVQCIEYGEPFTAFPGSNHPPTYYWENDELHWGVKN